MLDFNREGIWETGGHDMEARMGRCLYVLEASCVPCRVKIGLVGRRERVNERAKELARKRKCLIKALCTVELPMCDEQLAQHIEAGVRLWLTGRKFKLTNDVDWLLPPAEPVTDWKTLLSEACMRHCVLQAGRIRRWFCAKRGINPDKRRIRKGQAFDLAFIISPAAHLTPAAPASARRYDRRCRCGARP